MVLLMIDPGQCTQESIRLVNGDIAQEGRLEVCIDNVWGAVCGQEWNKIDALVACRELGLGVGGTHTYTNRSPKYSCSPVYELISCQ